jgi:hypothetical protein
MTVAGRMEEVVVAVSLQVFARVWLAVVVWIACSK